MIKQIWNDLVALVQKLVNSTFKTNFKWTNNDINNFIKASKRWVKEGDMPAGYGRIYAENLPAFGRVRSAMFFSPMKAFLSANNGLPSKATAKEYLVWFNNLMNKKKTSGKTPQEIHKNVRGGYISKSEFYFSGVGIWLEALSQNNPDRVITPADINKVLDNIQFTIRPYRHNNFPGMVLQDGKEHPDYEYFNLTLHISSKEIDRLSTEWEILEKRRKEAPTSDIKNHKQLPRH